MISRSDWKDTEDLLLNLIKRLERNYQSIIKEYQKELNMKLNGKKRESTQTIERKQYGYAVLYFTGSDHQNRSIRDRAQKNGYTRSNYGVSDTQRSGTNEKLWKGEAMTWVEEINVYKNLGLRYQSPYERSV